MKKIYLVVTLIFALVVLSATHLRVTEQKNEEIHNLKKEIKAHKGKIDTQNKKIDTYILNIESLEEKLDVAEDQVEVLKKSNTKNLKEIKTLKKKVKASEYPPSQQVSRGEQQKGFRYFETTFYTAGYESTQKSKGDPNYGKTASGTHVKEGRTVACPKSMKFGTKLYIEGFGYRVCEDRGKDIVENRLDIYVDSVKKARELGRQNVRVKVLN